MIKIRKLQASDKLAEISSIYEESWKLTYKGILPQDYLDNIPKGKWIKNLENPERHTLVAIKDDKIIGTSSYGESRTEELSGQGEIYSVYLLPEYIGKGYGKRLIYAALAELDEIGYANAFLWVLEDNMRARKFYESIGFTFGKAFKNVEIGGKNVREVRYDRLVKKA